MGWFDFEAWIITVVDLHELNLYDFQPIFGVNSNKPRKSAMLVVYLSRSDIYSMLIPIRKNQDIIDNNIPTNYLSQQS